MTSIQFLNQFLTNVCKIRKGLVLNFVKIKVFSFLSYDWFIFHSFLVMFRFHNFCFRFAWRHLQKLQNFLKQQYFHFDLLTVLIFHSFLTVFRLHNFRFRFARRHLQTAIEVTPKNNQKSLTLQQFHCEIWSTFARTDAATCLQAATPIEIRHRRRYYPWRKH